MPIGNIIGAEALTAGLVRAEPVQQRSTERLNALLDAAAAIIDEIGFDRMTTAMIAQRSDASIGTVYRYFPDRIAVLTALRERAVLRFRTRVVGLIEELAPSTWWDIVDCGITAFVELYRSEPGFRIIHFVDRQGGIPESEAGNQHLAKSFAVVIEEISGVQGEKDLTFRLEIATEMADAILSRAFESDPNGEDRFIDECRRVLHGYLTGAFEPVAG